MDNVNIKINGKEMSVPANITILEAARLNNIHIPTLCFLKGINEVGACRMCLVDVKGAKSLQASCVYPVSEGIEVNTNTVKVRHARKSVLELILSNHDKKCLTCVRNESCELQNLANELNLTEIAYEGENTQHVIDNLSPSIVRNNNKCVLCRRCVAVCNKVQTVSVIGPKERGFNTKIGSIYDKSLNDVSCINCGQCIQVCPTGALREKDGIDRVWEAIGNPKKHVVVQTAPAVRAALGEEFGMPIGTRVTGKMVSAIKAMGVDKVFDTDTAADLTIMEEGFELLDRVKNGGVMPMITSCSPGWINFAEKFYPEFIPNLSSCKSPHTMLGAIVKSYYAKIVNIDPKSIYMVSVMPCTAKKDEIERWQMVTGGIRDVDAVITTRELARMIKQSNLDFENLPDENPDHPLGEASGAGVIFGVTGGVMEAALRTVGSVLKGENLTDIEFNVLRGEDGYKEATVELSDLVLKGAVISGMGNARKLLDAIKSGEKSYDFIEIMGCPGGCIMGGGQPIVSPKVKLKHDVFNLRAQAIYDEDILSNVRLSHENSFIKKLYSEFLGEPNSELSHRILHTSYVDKEDDTKDLMDKVTIS